MANTSVPMAERAFGILDGREADPGTVADAQFVLARTLWKMHTDTVRALELARKAKASLAKVDGRWTHMERRIARWLADKPKETP